MIRLFHRTIKDMLSIANKDIKIGDSSFWFYEYDEPQSPYVNIANDDPREDPGTQSRVSRDPIPLFFLVTPQLLEGRIC
jgi:hypothetical protein